MNDDPRPALGTATGSTDDDGAAEGEVAVSAEDAVALEIRRRRLAAGWSQNQLAKRSGFDRQYISRAESTTRGLPSENLVAILDSVLDAGGALVDLRTVAAAERRLRREGRLLGHGETPVRSQGVASAQPSLDQPNDPLADVRRLSGRSRGADVGDPTKDELVDLISSHVEPRDCASGTVRPEVSLSGVGHESSVVPWDGDPALAADELAQLQHVDQQVGAQSAAPRVEDLLRRIAADLVDARGVDRRALLSTAARTAEFAAFCHRDLGMQQRCLYWHDRAVEYAQQADEVPMLAYVLLRKAQAAYDQRDAARMLDLTLAAARFAPSLGPGLTAEIWQQRARGEAMLGAHRDDVRRLLEGAAEILTTEVAPNDSNEPGGHYSQRLLGLQSALCLTEAGRPGEGVVFYRQVIGPDLPRRDHAYFSLLMAISLGLSGEPDEAASVACAALPVAVAARSFRSVREARTLAAVLAPWRGRELVQQFRYAVRSASEDSSAG